ncbi:hypothetical protein Tco_0006339 [Tanacetum coccineum]
MIQLMQLNHMMSFLTAVVNIPGRQTTYAAELQENTHLVQVEATRGENQTSSPTMLLIKRWFWMPMTLIRDVLNSAKICSYGKSVKEGSVALNEVVNEEQLPQPSLRTVGGFELT